MAKELTRTLEAWKRRALRASGFKDIEASGSDKWLHYDPGSNLDPERMRAGIYELHAEYHTRALLYAELIPPGDERDIWKMHADGYSFTDIAEELKVDRNRCYRVVQRHKAILFKKRDSKRGRPRKTEGYGRDSYRVHVRLNAEQTEGLFALKQKLGVSEETALRTAIIYAARNCVAPRR